VISRDSPIVLYPSGANWIAKWGENDQFQGVGVTPLLAVVDLVVIEDVLAQCPHATATLTCPHCGHTAVHVWAFSLGADVLECGSCGGGIPIPEVGGAKLGND